MSFFMYTYNYKVSLNLQVFFFFLKYAASLKFVHDICHLTYKRSCNAVTFQKPGILHPTSAVSRLT